MKEYDADHSLKIQLELQLTERTPYVNTYKDKVYFTFIAMNGRYAIRQLTKYIEPRSSLRSMCSIFEQFLFNLCRLYRMLSFPLKTYSLMLETSTTC